LNVVYSEAKSSHTFKVHASKETKGAVKLYTLITVFNNSNGWLPGWKGVFYVNYLTLVLCSTLHKRNKTGVAQDYRRTAENLYVTTVQPSSQCCYC